MKVSLIRSQYNRLVSDFLRGKIQMTILSHNWWSKKIPEAVSIIDILNIMRRHDSSIFVPWTNEACMLNGQGGWQYYAQQVTKIRGTNYKNESVRKSELEIMRMKLFRYFIIPQNRRILSTCRTELNNIVNIWFLILSFSSISTWTAQWDLVTESRSPEWALQRKKVNKWNVLKLVPLKGVVYSLPIGHLRIKLKVKGYGCLEKTAQTGKPVSGPEAACSSVPQGRCFRWAASQVEGSSESEAVLLSFQILSLNAFFNSSRSPWMRSYLYVTSWHKGWRGKPSM